MTQPIPTIEYSFTEKFFQIQPEGRIRRMQFLIRTLWQGIVIIFIAWFAVSGKTLNSSWGDVLFAWKLIMLGIICAIYLSSFYKTILKRINDINGVSTLLPLLIVAFVWMYPLFLIFAWINILMGGVFSENIWILADFSTIFKNIGWCFGCIFVIYLLFAKGKVGDNEFGKDPIKTKVSFFG